MAMAPLSQYSVQILWKFWIGGHNSSFHNDLRVTLLRIMQRPRRGEVGSVHTM